MAAARRRAIVSTDPSAAAGPGGRGASVAPDAEPWRHAACALAQVAAEIAAAEIAAAEIAATPAAAPAQATVLFADIRGFTATAEALGPQAAVRLLNDHFTKMVGCIEGEGGVVDKFIGDAVMAVFAADAGGSRHADRAVRTAIAMMRAVDDGNRQRAGRLPAPLAIGIGIHTGSVIATRLGPPHRASRTVIGEGASLAFRLERASRLYAAGILISAQTRRRLGGGYCWRPIDTLALKGRVRPVAVCEVLDHHTEASFPALARVLDAYRLGIAAYRRGRLAAALAAFAQALALHPADGPSRLYRQRCRAALALVAAPARAEGVPSPPE